MYVAMTDVDSDGLENRKRILKQKIHFHLLVSTGFLQSRGRFKGRGRGGEEGACPPFFCNDLFF